MTDIAKQLAALPTLALGGQPHLSYRAVTDMVAAALFPDRPADTIDAAGYQRILETADRYCRQLGYRQVVRLTPPDVAMADMGLYWTPAAANPEPVVIHVGPSPAEMLAAGQLLDARLGQLGLEAVSRQHFRIPVTASDDVVALMHRAVAGQTGETAWPNDYPSLWHDILGMCIASGREHGTGERHFTVLIRGVGNRRYWQFVAQLRQDSSGSPYLHIRLADETATPALFPLGQVVMTPGAAALGVDLAPYLARHAAGDWGDLDAFDQQQNETAIREGYRLLSAYIVPVGDGEGERIWVITEADRSVTTVLLPEEY